MMKIASIFIALFIFFTFTWSKLIQFSIEQHAKRSLDQGTPDTLADYTRRWENNYRSKTEPNKFQDSSPIAISAFDRIERVLDANKDDEKEEDNTNMNHNDQQQILLQQLNKAASKSNNNHTLYKNDDTQEGKSASSTHSTSSATMGVTLALAACFLML